MNRMIIAFTFILHAPILAADECVFDLEDQPRVINAVAEMYPGGEINHEKRQVSWAVPVEGVTKFIYGGCQHLGSEISQETTLPHARTKEQVFTLARQLSERFWDNAVVFSSRIATEAIRKALKQSEYTVLKAEGKTVFSIEEEVYAQLLIEHEYKNGVDRVSVIWVGDF